MAAGIFIYVSIDMLKSPTVREVLVNPSHFESKINEKKRILVDALLPPSLLSALLPVAADQKPLEGTLSMGSG